MRFPIRFTLNLADVAENICASLGVEQQEIKLSTGIQIDLLQKVIHIAVDCPENVNGYTPRMLSTEKLDLDIANGNFISLVSGGADSTIQWFLAGHPRAVYVDIGQPYIDKELNALDELGIPYSVYRTHNLYSGKGSGWQHIVPARNFLFLTLAAELISAPGVINFAVISGEGWYSGCGDKSKAFVDAWRDWYRAQTGKYITVATLHRWTKGECLREFISAGHDVNLIRHKTVTCFSAEEGQCGQCQACLRKFLSFMSIGVDTSIDYNVHPMIGGEQYVKKYLTVLSRSLSLKDFSHYSYARCVEDLAAIDKASKLLDLSYNIDRG